MSIRRTLNKSSQYTGFYNPEFYQIETPIPFDIATLSPVLWYDFSDSSTVTTSGSELTQITDKGSAGFTLAKSSTGPSYVTGINGLNCVDFGNSSHSNFLFSNDSTSINIAEFYIVLDSSFGATFPTYNGLITGYDSGGTAIWIIGGLSSAGLYPGSFDRAYLNGSTTDSYSSVLPTINSPCLLRVNRVNSTSLASTFGFNIGQDRTNYPRGWYGLIGEIVVFSSVLGTTDRDNVETFLANKWGLTLS